MIIAATGVPVSKGLGLESEAYVASLDGYDVRGRIASLGVVVHPDDPRNNPGGGSELVVVGGRSSLLHFHIPLRYVTKVSRGSRSVIVDLDVVDFTPRILNDGSVDLRLTA